MTANQKMTLRVILTEADIRKVILTTRPSTVEDLISKLKESLGLHYNFSLQYQDPEFNNELCNLTDTEELPEKPTVKVMPVLELVPSLTHPVQHIQTQSHTHLRSARNSGQNFLISQPFLLMWSIDLGKQICCL